MNGAVCKDRLFTERKGVLGPVTDEIYFRGLEGHLKMMIVLIIAMLPAVASFRVYMDLLFLT